MAIKLTIDKNQTTLTATDQTGRVICFYKDDIIFGAPRITGTRATVAIKTDNDRMFFEGDITEFAIPTPCVSMVDFLAKIEALINFNF